MIRPRLPFAFATVLMIAANAYADGNIRGTVFNKNSTEPLDFVSVQLVNPTTGVPMQIGTMTDENGTFVIERAPAGTYIIRFSNIGSITQEREIRIGDSEVNIGRIELADDAKLLQEVIVTGQSPVEPTNADIAPPALVPSMIMRSALPGITLSL